MPCALQAELDRFVNALIAIRAEIREVEQGQADKCAAHLLPCSLQGLLLLQGQRGCLRVVGGSSIHNESCHAA